MRTRFLMVLCISTILLVCVEESRLLSTFAEPQAIAATCQEDEPCWTWPTMGNHKRGVMGTDGRDYVVGPCRYRRMVAHHRIASTTPRLRGDAWARRYGCV